MSWQDEAKPAEGGWLTEAKPVAPPDSPRRKMAAAMDRLLPGVPESSEQAINMGMGMTMPNPLPFVGQFLKGSAKVVAEGAKKAAGSMFPKAVEAGGAALDPIFQQAPRNPLPALPKILEHVPGVGTPAKVYNMIRDVAEATPRKVPVSPYPAAPPAAPPPPSAPPPTPAAAPVQSVLPQATAQVPAPSPTTPPIQAPVAPQSVLPQSTAQPAVNIYELANRGRKVSELAKAIDANAGAHLGVNPADPRFAEALADLPQQWWEGMAQVAKINKPSPETIKEAISFFRDRASQTLRAAGQ